MWDWAVQNPWQAAWALFGVLTTLSTVYRRFEGRLKRYAARTMWEGDDRIVAALSSLSLWVAVLGDAVSAVAPTFAGRPSQDGLEAEEELRRAEDKV